MAAARTMPSWKRRPVLWLALALAVVLSLARGARLRAAQTGPAAPPAQAPASPAPGATPLSMQTALAEMAKLEAQLEQTQRQRQANEAQLKQAHDSLVSLEATLAEKSGLRQEGAQFFMTLDEQSRQTGDALQASIDRDRKTIDGARAALRLTSTELLAQADDPEATTENLLMLALLQRLHRDRAEVATQRVLRQEDDRARLAQLRLDATVKAEEHSIFSDFSVEQLRARHEELARTVAALQAHAQEEGQTEARLAQRRAELNGLVQQVAQREALRVAGEAQATPATTPVLLAVAKPPIPASAMSATSPEPTPAATSAAKPGGVGAPEVPYESGSTPLVSQAPLATPEGDPGQNIETSTAAGTRRLFWRALPMQVLALAGGKVAFSGPFAGYRHLLIVDHGNGWRTLYGNLTRCALAEGATVTGGQPLGEYQATSGAFNEPFWFEVRQGVRAVAPEQWPALPNHWESQLFAPIDPRATPTVTPVPTPPDPRVPTPRTPALKAPAAKAPALKTPSR